MHTRFTLKRTSAMAMISVCATSVPAFTLAQEEASLRIEEITVTARRTDENLMQVPVAISAVTSAAIENIGLKDVIELSKYTPGLTASVGGNGRVDRSGTRLTFRGLSVASGLFFIDGAPYVGSNSPDVTDVARVEVLKGPQSAYFGRSTFAGAVNLVPKEPSRTFQGRVKVKGTSFDGLDLNVSAEGPIIADKLGVRVSGRHYTFGGYYVNGGDPSSRMGEQATDSISMLISATPSDRLSIKSYLSFTEDDDGVPNTAALKSGSEIFCDLGGGQGGGAYHCGELPKISDLNQTSVISVNDWMDPFTYDELINNAKQYPVTFDPRFNAKYGFRRQTSVAHLKLDYEFDSGLSLQATSAWHRTKSASINDQIYRDGRGVPNPLFGVRPNAPRYRQFTLLLQSLVNDFSQELRITSPQEQRLRGTFGASYFRQWGPPGTNSGVSPQGRHTGSQSDSEISTPAVYGGVYYDVTDKVTLGAEARYQWDTIEQQAVFPNVGPALKETFESFSPRVTVDYEYSDTGMVYALYSKGFQPGGFNTSLVNQPQSILDQIAVAGSNLTYEQEELDNYEIGLKSTWLDQRLRTTLAAYTSKWTNGQVTNSVFVTRPDGTLLATSVTANIGRIDLRGIELEADYVATRNLSISASFNYADNEIKSYNYIPGGIKINNNPNVAGNQLDQSPKASWSFSPTYTRHLTGDYGWFTRLDYTGRSKVFVDPTNVAWIAPTHLVNLRLGVENDDLRIEAFVTNLTDDKNPTEGVRANDVYFSNSVLNEIRLGLPDKRTYGMTLTYEF